MDLPGRAVVIRFRPTSPDAVLRSAQKEARRVGRHGLSVFADVCRGGETEQDVIERLLKASELAGVQADSNRKYFVCTRAGDLLALGFTFYKDGDDDEIEEHYSVDLGRQPTLEAVERFLQVFEPGLRRQG